MSAELLRSEALYRPFAFPRESAMLTVEVDGIDKPTSLVSASRWGASKNQSGVGTAWLIAIDAASSMGPRLGEAKDVAKELIGSMQTHDIVDVMFFNDRAVVKHSDWLADKAAAVTFVDSVPSTYPREGRTRKLDAIIRQVASDGFEQLERPSGNIEVPLHQSMVVLSNGVSGSVAGAAAETSLAVGDYLTRGRFPDGNSTLSKMPVSIVAIWLPTRQQEVHFQNAQLFMQNLANPQIGGYFGIIREGQKDHAGKIVTAVRNRFDQMSIVRWRVPCIANTPQQTFKLVFQGTDTPIVGDDFGMAPLGLNPSLWPLDVDATATTKAAKRNKLRPGGTVKVFGNFCWGSDRSRAQLFMIPKMHPSPLSLAGRTVDESMRARSQLVATNITGTARAASDAFVEFDVPNSTQFLSGKGKQLTARLMVFDTRGQRSSAFIADKILTVQAGR
jgi:hypothetical protein